MAIKFGPAGLGAVKTAEETLEHYNKLGLKACEIAFTYSIYIKSEKDAERIGKKARELDIILSIHAPYWINLNSTDRKKTEESKKRILDCCKIGHYLGVETVVFHPGYYGKMSKEETYNKIKLAIDEMLKEIKKNKWNIKIAPETTGKINVFGSLEEISKLARETGCSFCIDFAHIKAREKEVDYKRVEKLFPEKEWHVHFSGIEYGEKGERNHRETKKEEWAELLNNLPKNKEILIINEAPNPIKDSFEGLNLYKKL